jgi:Asp-tRNA(Asn)/Glu-tRNA(Gln) amidotransferase A subunit family amidase
MGMVALRGVTPLAQSLDALGLFAREVADLQLLHSSLHRNAALPQAAPACLPRRLLLVDGSLFGAVEPCMSDALHASADQLRTLGIDVRPASGLLTDALLQEATRVHHRLMAREAYENLAFESSHHRDLLSPQIQELLDTGRAVSGAEHAALLQSRAALARQLDDALAGWDAVLAPAANGGAPQGLGATGRPDQSRAWQLLGLPQISLPVATDPQGLPLGLQLIGRYGQDAALLATARALQERLGWRAVLPPMVR